MTTNFWWLFAAYAVVWVALIGYAGVLHGRLRKAERDLEILKQSPRS
ncbi:MAG TPA: CcmD family protein [Candidatus Krumholzibacteria bacterium]|jgi:CcmD family protein